MLYKKEYIQMLRETEMRLKSIVSTLETNYEPFKEAVLEHKEQRRNRNKIEFTEEEQELLNKLDALTSKFEELYEKYEEV